MDERPAGTSHLVLPVGTQVVTRVASGGPEAGRVRPRGAVGEVVRAPSDVLHAHRVRFPDGSEASFRREELAIRKQVQASGLEMASSPATYAGLLEHVIYRCVVGSRAYGLDEPGSDADRRGIYLPPADLHWSLEGVPDQLENLETEECYWELQKFLTLALKANPNVLECLYTPLVERATPLAEELLEMRGIFLSRLIYQTYNGYVMSQFKKLEGDLRLKGAIRWKHAMHLIRLFLSGITVLEEGFVPVRIEAHRDRLLAIRRGEMPWEDVNAWRLALYRAFDAAYATTRLPDRPDFEQANALLLKARRSQVEGA